MTYKRGFLIPVLLLFLMLPASLYSSDLYMVRDVEEDLVKFDLGTFSLESVGALEIKLNSSGMAWHAPSGKLLVVRVSPGSLRKIPKFYFVDPETSETEYLGEIDLGVDTGMRGAGLTIDPLTGRIFLGHARSIFEIDLESLSATEFGTIPGEISPPNVEDRVSLNSLAFDAKNRRMVSASSNLDIDPRIFSIDPDSGEISQLCTIKLPAGFSSWDDSWIGFHSGGLTYDPIRNSFWRTGRFEPLLELKVEEDDCEFTIYEVAVTTEAVALVPSFSINAGLNDAWYNPATNGQGFLITVLPDIERVFVAWFTFDTERPQPSTPSGVGEPGHRWLIAQGPYSGDTATLTLYVSEGGVFDSITPEATTDPTGDGTLTIEFADCSNAIVTYDITSAGLSGEIPIERIAIDNVSLCESLAGQ